MDWRNFSPWHWLAVFLLAMVVLSFLGILIGAVLAIFKIVAPLIVVVLVGWGIFRFFHR